MAQLAAVSATVGALTGDCLKQLLLIQASHRTDCALATAAQLFYRSLDGGDLLPAHVPMGKSNAWFHGCAAWPTTDALELCSPARGTGVAWRGT